MLDADISRIENAQIDLFELALGGTAVGTGLIRILILQRKYFKESLILHLWILLVQK